MARLIDADAFRKSINGWKLGKIPKGELLWDLDRQPTVDAVEVVHGRWLWHDGEFEYVCSACKCRFDYNHTFGIFDHGYEYGNYCPNCGAYMRERKDNG